MNTVNMPDQEELDRLFRQAADSYEPEFEPEAWQAMEQKLDGTTTPKTFWQKKWLTGLLLLLIGLTGLFVYRQSTRRVNKPESTDKITAAAPVDKDKAITKNTPDHIPEKEINYSASPGKKINQANKNTARYKAARLTDQAEAAEPGNNKRVINHANRNSQKQAQLPLPPTDKTFRPALSINRKTDAPVTGPDTSTNDLNTNQPIIPFADTTQKQPPQSAILQQTPAVTPVDSLTRNNQSNLIPKGSTQPALRTDSTLNQRREKWWSKFSVSLVLGPDFSTVGLVRPEQASVNVGGILSYQFNGRWAVVTGLLRARKVYGAKPEDYHPGANYWPPGSHLPDDINAVCQVLDIPVNIRYSVIALPKQTVYVQTGLSSYVMLKEDYRYDYDNYGKPYSKHWIVSNKNKHYLGVLNLAVGYSRQVSTGISVGTEPFVKIPLNGIGAGKVNLTSVGALFSLGYHFK